MTRGSPNRRAGALLPSVVSEGSATRQDPSRPQTSALLEGESGAMGHVPPDIQVAATAPDSRSRPGRHSHPSSCAEPRPELLERLARQRLTDQPQNESAKGATTLIEEPRTYSDLLCPAATPIEADDEPEHQARWAQVAHWSDTTSLFVINNPGPTAARGAPGTETYAKARRCTPIPRQTRKLPRVGIYLSARQSLSLRQTAVGLAVTAFHDLPGRRQRSLPTVDRVSIAPDTFRRIVARPDVASKDATWADHGC